MESLENPKQLMQVINGELTGTQAADLLRAALAEIHAAEAGLAEWRKLVSVAESRLVYGPNGRPSPMGSSWGISPKDLSDLESKKYDSNEIPSLHRSNSNWDDDKKIISIVRTWADQMESARQLGMPASITPELIQALSALGAKP